MTTYVLDTSAYSIMGRNRSGVVHQLVQTAEHIWIPSIVLGELLYGFVNGNRETNNRRNLQRFMSLSRTAVASVDSDSAERYAIIYQYLRKQGTPIPINDIWIAAITMQYGATLLTADAHFQNIPHILARNLT